MDPFDLPSVDTREDEEDRERRWVGFEADCADFAKSEPDGWSAVLRAVARAMKEQRELIRG